MIYVRIQKLLPAFLRHYVLHFERGIELSAEAFAAALPAGARVLDAGGFSVELVMPLSRDER